MQARKEALFYEKLENKAVDCYLCNHHCRIAENKFGFCGVRQNLGGILYTLVYGLPAALHIDPIEKKPLYHFLPGSFSFSLATIGCNFRCGFCQNWQISQASFRDGFASEVKNYPAQEIVNQALKNKCRSISYTYSEPTIFFEYALDIARLAKAKGLYNVFVSNGYMGKEALKEIRPYLDAANVDLKFFRDDSYHRICRGRLEPVLNSLRLMKEMGIWVEITTLVVTGENDSLKELTDIARFIADLDKNIPWHVSRFHPDYQFSAYAPTADKVLVDAQAIGKSAGLNFVYPGNIHGFANNTYCPACRKLLIQREVFEVLENNIKQGKCIYCGEAIKGKFS